MHSDKELQIATQIAYMDFDIGLIDSKEYTLRELLLNHSTYLADAERELRNSNDEIARQEAQAKIDLYNQIIAKDSQYGNWKIVDIGDDNANSGFYACTIETDEGDAIIGFRGSESSDSIQVSNDWIEADLGLLNNDETKQQERAEAYMKHLYEKFGEKYLYTLTGHSLGGNLAIHGGLSASEEMRSQIQKVVSFDGPGFSDEYIREHINDINEMENKMITYQWSIVSKLLFPASEIICVRISEAPINSPEDIANILKYYLYRHDTCFLEYDENGNVIEGNGFTNTLYEGSDTVIGIVSKVADLAGTVTALGTELADQIIYTVIAEKNYEGYKALVEKYNKVISWMKDKIIESCMGTADFEVQFNVLKEVSEIENSITNELNCILNEINGIKGKMPVGLSFWLAKLKLERLSGAINTEKRNLHNMVASVQNIADKYAYFENCIINNATSLS